MRSNWKLLLRSTLLGVCVSLSAASATALAQDGLDLNEAERMLELNMVDLRDQLYAGLRLTTQDQKHFIQRVLSAVEQNRIPRAMVNVVYVWSKEKNARYPFIYFQIAIRVLAERRGVSFD